MIFRMNVFYLYIYKRSLAKTKNTFDYQKRVSIVDEDLYYKNIKKVKN